MYSFPGQMTSRLIVLTILLGRGVGTTSPKMFDLSADFSFEQTSASTWQYGYSASNSLATNQFRLDTYLDKRVPISFWHPATKDRNRPGYYPYVAHNERKESQLEPTHGWAARAGEVAMEASNSGEYSLVRFLVPVSGCYQVKARFEGIHFRLSSTDVHILHGSVHLFDADIDGYGGDTAFHPIEGAHPTASYDGSVLLKAHDTVTFAVGYGENKTNYNDTTGLFARLVLLSSLHGH
jgi:hypothetical protein